MSTLYRTSRASSASRSTNNQVSHDSSNVADEENDNFNFLVYLRNIFAPYIEKALAIADRYRLFDLVTYVFEDVQGRDEEPEGNDPELMNSMQKCVHPAHVLVKKGFYTNEIPVNYFSEMMEQEHKDPNAGTIAMVHYKMNNIYVKRLLQIHSTAPKNTSIKLVTYQEWVDVLLKLNKSLLKSVGEIENIILKRFKQIEETEKRMKNELDDSRHDLLTLTRFIKTAFYQRYWNKEDLLQLRTIVPSSVFEE